MHVGCVIAYVCYITVCVYIYIYIHIHVIRISIIIIMCISIIVISGCGSPRFRGGDDTVGNPHRAQISQFELFELILFLTLTSDSLSRAIRADSVSVNGILPPPS